jgi:hypothetical protein
MAKLKATVNGVKLKDGEKVTLVIQATTSIVERPKFDGGLVRYVEFLFSEDQDTIDAWPKDDAVKVADYEAPGVTVVKR